MKNYLLKDAQFPRCLPPHLSRRRYFFTLVLLVLLLSVSADAQNTPKNVVITTELLGRVKAIAFPRATSSFDVTEEEFSIDVSIDPSFGSPVHISIVKPIDGMTRVVRYVLKDQSESFGKQVERLVEKGIENPEELARELGVVRREIRPRKGFESLLNKFYSNTIISRSTKISLDGVAYKVWYRDPENEWYYSSVGGTARRADEPRMITWARSIVHELD